MDINRDYKLSEDSFFKKEFKKQQIVIGNTLNKGLLHYESWNKKLNGKYKGTSPYTIGLDGTIYEHYDPKYYSSFLLDSKINKKIVPILLENEGWVGKDFNNKRFLMWNGDIYNRTDPLVEVKWRGKHRWAPYTQEQMESLIKLCNHLFEKFKINKTIASDNLIIENVGEMKGLYFKSNYSKNFLDVSPAFDINYLNENIKNERKFK